MTTNFFDKTKNFFRNRKNLYSVIAISLGTIFLISSISISIGSSNNASYVDKQIEEKQNQVKNLENVINQNQNKISAMEEFNSNQTELTKKQQELEKALQEKEKLLEEKQKELNNLNANISTKEENQNNNNSSNNKPSGNTSSSYTAPTNPNEPMVWLTKSGSKYHKINKCGKTDFNSARQVPKSEAELTHGPCNTCYK